MCRYCSESGSSSLGDGPERLAALPTQRGEGGSSLGSRSEAEAGERGAARAGFPVERGDPAHQRQSRARYGLAGGPGQRPGPDRRPVRCHHDRRRGRARPGLREFGRQPRGAPADGRMARRAASVRAPAEPAGTPETSRPGRLRAVPRPVLGAATDEDVPGHPDAASGRGRGQLLPRRQGRRRRVHRRGRGDPDAVRFAGGHGDRQRPYVSARAAGPGRPGSPDRHLTGGGRGS